jgi:hypothetical protein
MERSDDGQNARPREQAQRNFRISLEFSCQLENAMMEALVGFGRGLLLWLLGIPLPIIILLALFWHH